MKKFFGTREIVLCAMMIAMSVVLSLFDIPVPFAGAIGIRISISGFVSKIPAIMYGPVIGGVCSGLMDVISHFVKPEGPFMWQLTASAILGGVMVGLLWKLIKGNREDNNRFEKIFFATAFIIGGIGAINLIFTLFFPQSAYSLFIFKMGVTSKGVARYDFVTYGLILIFVVALLISIINAVYKKKTHAQNSSFIKVLIALLIANITVTTINTFLLRLLLPSLGSIAFWVYYIPRLVEEIVMTCIQAAGVTYLLKVISSIERRKY